MPPIATNAVWFAHPQDHARHRLLAAIARNATLTTLPAGALAPRDAWLKPGPEMARLFPDCGVALRNAVELAERCGGGPPARRVILPPFAPPPPPPQLPHPPHPRPPSPLAAAPP